jgi:putative acetyltransferase
LITIRPETSADYPAVYKVNQLAFNGRDSEPGLVEAVRKSDGYIPELSLVAEEDGQVVGHILFSRIVIETPDGTIPALSLAPMAVLPGHQNKGIGSALVRAGMEACKQLGHGVVIVLGHPNYYPRFGFSAALAEPLECPYGAVGGAWMAAETIPGALKDIRGKVVYPAYFDGV